MNLCRILEENYFAPAVIALFAKTGIKELFPPQAEAIQKGVLNGHNLLLSVPTASGKTLIAELCILKALADSGGQGHCLYIAPLKALASEKYQHFKQQYESLGYSIGMAVGDERSDRKTLSGHHILVATAEKIDSLLRSKSQWLISSLNVVVLDEIHFINDGSRGPTLEILTARIRQMNPNIQFLALSATVSNAQDMAKWLNAELVSSTWRPIPLKEGVYYNNQIVFHDNGTRLIPQDDGEDLNSLVDDTLQGKGQVLVFVNARRSAEAVGREICKTTARRLTFDEKTKLASIAQKIAGTKADGTKLCRKLADAVICGAAFHHAGLKPFQRDLVEQNFKANLIKVISCTPTLAAGVNLPARRAIIRDVKRFESGLGSAYIPVSEYKQCAGRAGRPQYDDHGEAVIMAKTESEASTLMERYILADPEPVISKLHDESALRVHILASIVGGYVHDTEGMFEFISHTFLYHQNPSRSLFQLITRIFDFLQEEKFIEQSGTRFFATQFGSLTSRLYVDPVTSLVIRNTLRLIAEKSYFPPVGFLHALTCCPDMPVLNTGKKDTEALDEFVARYHEEMILNPEQHSETNERLQDFYVYMRTLKTTFLLSQWMEELREEDLCDQFGVGPGDIYRFVESADRLLYAAGAIAELLRMKQRTFDLNDLKTRVRYGVKEELLDVVQLKGVGRVRARNLFAAGIKKITDLKHISAAELAKIPAIGSALAQDILTQSAKT
ncbi:MAG: DEAD/DEAH box helicase [Candidatus Omnitrophica bacterium]|nr:DEAD/DEAH box helicase [Candidatus Omnitrophota bacterium]